MANTGMAGTAAILCDHERLFRDLGQDLGLEALGFTPDGLCLMSFDAIELRFEYQGAYDELLVTAVIGPVPLDPSGRVMRSLLELSALSMASRGGTVGLRTGEDALIWLDRVAVRGLGFPTFRSWLEESLAQIEAWFSMLERLQQAATPTLQTRPAEGCDVFLARV